MNRGLRAARDAAKKTQAQVAKAAQISGTHYQNIEYGNSEPTVQTALRIADELGIKTLNAFKKIWKQESQPDKSQT